MSENEDLGVDRGSIYMSARHQIRRDHGDHLRHCHIAAGRSCSMRIWYGRWNGYRAIQHGHRAGKWSSLKLAAHERQSLPNRVQDDELELEGLRSAILYASKCI